ncbi:dihydrodipicolinate reductase [Firmicutes bacterium M10-2]|nr:dihydrodipicolinate reductase [Firmicutes bacterium M10-2]
MNVLIVGKGKMGQLLEKRSKELGMDCLGCCDVLDPSLLKENKNKVDVILDFSHPDNLDWILEEIKDTNIALVEGTTALSETQKQALIYQSKENAIFYSANYSFGIAIFHKILKTIVPLLKENFDIELSETHHNQKADAPSGTALALLETIDPNNEFKHVFERNGIIGKREKEIGISTKRGGTIPGIHEVDFFGNDETLEIKHTAYSRMIFVDGALKAAKFMESQVPGLYNMDDLLK